MQRDATIQGIIDNFGQLKRALHNHFMQAFEALGLSPAQYDLLRTLHANQPMSHKELAAKVQLTPGAITQLLDGLEEAGCIVRTRNEADRRISYLTVNRIGKQKLDSFMKLRTELLTSAFDTFSDDELINYQHAQQQLTQWFEAQAIKTDLTKGN